MKIKTLHLKNYRNYINFNISFGDSLNIIVGDNGIGKTNIIEAIYMLAITKPFLSIPEKKTINEHANFAVIIGEISVDNYIKKLELILSNFGKKVKIDHCEKKKLSEYISTLKVIIFTPDDIRLIKDGPGIRRKFLNIELCQIFSNYLTMLNSYNLVLKQRNEYLKSISYNKYDNIYLNILDNKMANFGYQIYSYRKKFISIINKYIGKIFENFSGLSGLKIKYISTLGDIEKYKSELKENLERDIKYKFTQSGIHRDDFIFELNEKNLLYYGSQGQMRMAILALKLAEVFTFKEFNSNAPILILDDVFSELDVEKRNQLIKFLKDDIQVIVTTTDVNLIKKEYLMGAKIISLEEINKAERM